MKLRVNAELYEHSCSNPDCEQKAYAKKGIVIRCGVCKKQPVMQPGLFFSSSMVATKPMTTIVAKSPSVEPH